jgi:hypothetical protein
MGIASKYNDLLHEWPIITKSVTSGIMYGAGDLLCQVGEAAHNNKPLRIEWKRTAVMATFGTVVSGPLYHYWFAYLDTFPIRMYELRKQRQRWKILRAYNLLKSHNVPVGELVLPDTKPFHKWTMKFSKIMMDQLVFSSAYMVLFFMGVGVMNEAVGVGKKQPQPPEIAGMIHSLNNMKTETNLDAIENIIRKLEISHEHQNRPSLLTMIKHSWDHTKEVYLTTYIADWVVWPPLQLVNFTFVPLRYQVLYVNVCNLMWNTFLSFMANGGH